MIVMIVMVNDGDGRLVIVSDDSGDDGGGDDVVGVMTW